MNPPPNQPPYPNTNALAIVPRSRADADDATLLKRMASGDEQSLGAFYDRWHPMVYAIALRIVRQRTDAEDVVEETFWQAWRQAERYDESRGGVQTWLLTMARSRALDRVRSLKRTHEDLIDDVGVDFDALQSTDSSPALDAESAERRRYVLAALSELPPEQREALELGYFSGLSQSEISEQTRQPLGTIKTRMRLAMQKLRERLQFLREDAR